MLKTLSVRVSIRKKEEEPPELLNKAVDYFVRIRLLLWSILRHPPGDKAWTSSLSDNRIFRGKV